MTNLNSESANPDTHEGQAVGAILTVKQKPWYPADIGPSLLTEVGDRIKVLQHFRKECAKVNLVKVRNLRTGGEGVIGWSAFRAVSTRKMCGCPQAKCGCVYEDFHASLAYKVQNI